MNIATLAGAVGLIGSIAAGAYFLDERHASKAEFTVLATSFQNFAREAQLRSLRHRLWQLENRYGNGCAKAPREIKTECFHLRQDIQRLVRLLTPRR